MSTGWWLAALLSPLLAAPLTFILGYRALPWLPLVAAALVLLGLAGLLPAAWRGETLLYAFGDWAPPVGIAWRLDGLAWAMLAVTAVVSLAVVLFAPAYLPAGGRRGALLGFWPTLLLLWAGLNALFLSADVFNLYVTLELVSLAAVALVTLNGSRRALAAGLRYLLVTLAGSLSYLLGVAMLYAGFGSLDLSLLGQALTAGPAALLALGLMTTGLLAKAALFPLHVWLPPAHSQAPAPASAMLSALVVMAALYVLLRLWAELFAPVASPAMAQAAGALGAAAVLWGSWQALGQVRLKLLVAYSTVAQLGYPLLILPLLGGPAPVQAWSGGLVLLLSHALAKAAMFLGAGVIMHSRGHDRVMAVGMGQRLPMTMFAMGLAGLTLMGLPPSGGFIGKWLLLESALAAGQWWWALVLILGGLLAAAYIFRILAPALRQAAQPEPARPQPRRLELVVLALAASSMLLGLAPAGLVRLLGAPGGAP